MIQLPDRAGSEYNDSVPAPTRPLLPRSHLEADPEIEHGLRVVDSEREGDGGPNRDPLIEQ